MTRRSGRAKVHTFYAHRREVADVYAIDWGKKHGYVKVVRLRKPRE